MAVTVAIQSINRSTDGWIDSALILTVVVEVVVVVVVVVYNSI